MSLKETRYSVATDLQEAGLTAHVVVPPKVVPPCVVIEPANPYVTEDETFSKAGFKTHLDLFVMVPNATVQTMTDNLDDLIEEVVNQLGEWQVGGISLVLYEQGESRWFAARVPITKYFNLGGNN